MRMSWGTSKGWAEKVPVAGECEQGKRKEAGWTGGGTGSAEPHAPCCGLWILFQELWVIIGRFEAKE